MSVSSSPEIPIAAKPENRGWWGGWPGRVVRVGFAVLPLLWLSQRIKFRDVYAQATAVGPRAFAIALLAFGAAISVASVRWAMLMRAYGATETPSWAALTRHFLIGGYFAVLPSGVAGDAVRGLRVRPFLPDLTTSYVVIFVERLSGLLGLSMIATTAAMTSASMRTSVVTQVLNLAFVLGVAMSAGVLLTPYVIARNPRIQRLIASIPVVGKVILGVPPPRVFWRLLIALILSIPTQAGVIVAVYAIMVRLCPWVTLGLCARAVPGVTLFTYVPLTPGGVGQREAAFTYLFGLAGVPADVAVATSLLFFAVSMLVALLGGLCLVYERAAGIKN